VLVDGRIVVRDGVLKTADLSKIRATANTEARRLAAAVSAHPKASNRLRQ